LNKEVLKADAAKVETRKATAPDALTKAASGTSSTAEKPGKAQTKDAKAPKGAKAGKSTKAGKGAKSGLEAAEDSELDLIGEPSDGLDDGADAAEVIELPPAPAPTAKKNAKDKRAREKALRDAWASMGSSEEELAVKRNKLKSLIKLGKDRGFLTYAEINDHLPEDLVDAEAIESIISTFSDMGITVYEKAPDAETLLINDSTPVVSSDEDA